MATKKATDDIGQLGKAYKALEKAAEALSNVLTHGDLDEERFKWRTTWTIDGATQDIILSAEAALQHAIEIRARINGGYSAHEGELLGVLRPRSRQEVMA